MEFCVGLDAEIGISLDPFPPAGFNSGLGDDYRCRQPGLMGDGLGLPGDVFDEFLYMGWS